MGSTLRPAAEVSQGDWLLRYSAIEPLVVQSYVSAGFPAYARVLNPANGFDGAAVRWSKIAQEIGVELTAETQWSDLAAEFQDEDELINLDAPDWSPDPAVARALTSVLRSHTGSAQDCYFLIWEGYASVSDYVFGLDAPKVAVSQHRSLFLLNGSLQDACEPFIENDGRLPNWWWPATQEWCVGNDIYARSSFVGGSQECIDAVLSQPELEALPISPYSRVYEGLN